METLNLGHVVDDMQVRLGLALGVDVAGQPQDIALARLLYVVNTTFARIDKRPPSRKQRALASQFGIDISSEPMGSRLASSSITPGLTPL
jgi:hypothetical protein